MSDIRVTNFFKPADRLFVPAARRVIQSGTQYYPKLKCARPERKAAIALNSVGRSSR